MAETPEGCVRVPSRIAKLMGWAGSKVDRAKAGIAEGTSALQRRVPRAYSEDLKPLYEHRDRLRGTENRSNAILGRLESIRAPKRSKAKAEASQFYKEAVAAAHEAGEDISRLKPPENAYAAVHEAERLRKRASELEFQRDALERGAIGPISNPNFKPAGARYRELSRGKELSQYGIRPHLKDAHEQILSGHQPLAWNRWQRLKNASTSTLMWTPAFHTVTIGSRFIVPALERKNLVGTASAMAEAVKDLADPKRAEELGQKGLIRLAPHGWEGSMTATERGLAKSPLKRFGSALVHSYNTAMSSSINFMLHTTYHIALQDYLKQGMPRAIAERAAAEKATTLAGTIHRDSMSPEWRAAADKYLFSTRYTTTTINMATRAVAKDQALRSRLEAAGFKPEAVEQALKQHRTAFQLLLAKDYISMIAVANALNYMFTGLNNMPDKNGKKGAHAIWDNPGSTWYTDMVNMKFVGGIDDKTGKPIMVGVPFRSLRDVLETVLDPIAVVTGADTSENLLQTEVNKTNQFMKVLAIAMTGRDWKGQTVVMPSGGETVANAAGAGLENLQPLPIRDLMVETATRINGGDPAYKAVAKALYNTLSDADVKMIAFHALGGQTSLGEKPGQPVKEAFNLKDRVENWLSSPSVKAALQKGDPKMQELARHYMQGAGMSGLDIESRLRYIAKGGAPDAMPSSRVRRVAEQQQENP